MSPVHAVLAGVVLVVMGCAILGIGMGEAPAEREPAPSAGRLAAAKPRLASAPADVKRARELFEDEGCDRCHSIAAIGADGKLGPRLDTLDDDSDDTLESITDPRDETTDGYPETLMPTDFAVRLSDAELQALATFVTTVSRGEEEDREDDESSGKGRGRNRSRGGSG